MSICFWLWNCGDLATLPTHYVRMWKQASCRQERCGQDVSTHHPKRFCSDQAGTEHVYPTPFIQQKSEEEEKSVRRLNQSVYYKWY